MHSQLVVQDDCWSSSHHVCIAASMEQEGSSLGLSSLFKSNSQIIYLPVLLISLPLNYPCGRALLQGMLGIVVLLWAIVCPAQIQGFCYSGRREQNLGDGSRLPGHLWMGDRKQLSGTLQLKGPCAPKVCPVESGRCPAWGHCSPQRKNDSLKPWIRKKQRPGVANPASSSRGSRRDN